MTRPLKKSIGLLVMVTMFPFAVIAMLTEVWGWVLGDWIIRTWDALIEWSNR